MEAKKHIRNYIESLLYEYEQREEEILIRSPTHAGV